LGYEPRSFAKRKKMGGRRSGKGGKTKKNLKRVGADPARVFTGYGEWLEADN